MEFGRTRSGCSWKSQEMWMEVCEEAIQVKIWWKPAGVNRKALKYVWQLVEVGGSRWKSMEVGGSRYGSSWKSMEADLSI